MAERVEIPTGWTPGPWKDTVEQDEYSVDRDGEGLCYSAVGTEHGEVVALVVVPSSWDLDDLQAANAALIAAAPDMAAELTALREREAVLREALTDARQYVAGDRDHLVDCFTTGGGDRETMDEGERDIVAEADRVIARIDAALTSEGQ